MYIAVEVDIEDEQYVLDAEAVQLELQREFEAMRLEWLQGRQGYQSDSHDSVVARPTGRELFGVLRHGRLLKGGMRYYAPRARVNAIFAGQALGLLITEDSSTIGKVFLGWASGTK